MKISECKVGMKCRSKNNPIAKKEGYVYEIIEVKKTVVHTRMKDGLIHKGVNPSCLELIPEE